MTMSLEVNDGKVKAMLAGAAAASFDPTRAWLEVARYMAVQTSAMFAHIHSVETGGTYRGVTWKRMADQYTRKTGRQVVPAWGGVPRIHAGWRKGKTNDAARPGLRSTGERMSQVRGVVSGRLRPSGKRVKRSSALMQDSMQMRKTATSVLQRDRTLLRLGPQGANYAAAQNRRRPFLFFQIPEDAEAIGRIFAAHIAKGAKGGTVGAGG
jgi:hypothetical protein